MSSMIEGILLVILAAIVDRIIPFLPTVWRFFVDAWREYAKHQLRGNTPAQKFKSLLFLGIEYYGSAALAIITVMYYFCSVFCVIGLSPDSMRSLIYATIMTGWLGLTYLWIIPPMQNIRALVAQRRLNAN